MKKKIYYICLVAIFFFGLSLWAWFKVPESHSDAERRALSQFPAISKESVLNGEFMTDFESYTLDQFPLRDTFRNIKALSRMQLFRQKDNNDIYLADGYVSKLEYPMNENMLELAGEKFQTLYDSYLKDTDVNVYFSIVPDKNLYLAEDNGYLSMDYDAFFDKMQELTPYMNFIDLREQLSIEDYYYTDTHWKQENLLPVAETLVGAMNKLQMLETSVHESAGKQILNWQYEKKVATDDFNGVYVGQSALNLKPETLSYLTNEQLKSCTVTSYSTGKAKDIFMYALDKVDGKDPYEMFLNGTEALITIENPNATTDKELVVFRDSFGSSLIPLLVENYSKITVVDIRYMDSSVLGNFVEFSNQDVLFLYSTLVLNASSSLRVTTPK